MQEQQQKKKEKEVNVLVQMTFWGSKETHGPVGPKQINSSDCFKSRLLALVCLVKAREGEQEQKPERRSAVM